MAASEQQRESFSFRLDREAAAIVEHVAELERRHRSELIRNIVVDWARTYSVDRDLTRGATS
jgi:predicted transcriptional regulator